MRPFKFFFALSVGLVLLFFLFKVFFTALIIAGFLSLGFFIARKIRGAIYRRSSYYEEERGEDYLVPQRWAYSEEPLAYHKNEWSDRLTSIRFIKVQ